MTDNTTGPRASGAFRVSGPMQARFRDWVLEHRRYAFTRSAVVQGLPCSTGQAHALLKWAERRQIVQPIGPLLTGKQGKPAVVYAYRLRADERVAGVTPPATGGVRVGRVTAAPTGRRRLPTRSDVRRLVQQLRTAGWRVEQRRGHWVARPPGGGRVVVLPGTPSDHRALDNARAQLRRAGAAV